MAKDIKCTCGHSWNKSDSSKKDMYVCHICGNNNVTKAQVGYKFGKSEDEVRQAVLKRAAQVFAGNKKPYKLPESIEKIEGSGRNVCISGVCGILSDAGFIPDDYYTNTSFVEKASGLGFGNPQTDMSLLKPGDVFQHLVDTNEQGNRYPTHAEIFKGWNDKGEAEFYDYYDFYNWPVSKSSGIRTYDRSELEQRLSRKAKNDQSDIQAQFFSLAGGQNKATKSFPYNLPENELKDYFEKTHAANTTFSAPAPTIDKNSPLYYSSGEDVRQGTREGLADMFNNKELDSQLKRELKITDQDLQKIKPLIYGVVGQESQFNNPRSTTGGLKYMFENMFSPKGKSLGPGQIKLKSITPSVKEAFGIKKGSDLQDLKNTYVGLADIISKSANITDKYVSQETHPDLVDKDRFERALYFLNSPGKVRRSDKQNYDNSLQSNSVLTNFSEQAMMDAVDRANKTKLSMDPGSYPAKVLDRAKELKTNIDFEDTSILPEVMVTSTKKKKEDGGWLNKFEQGGMVLEQQRNDNYGKKANPNDVQISVGPDFVGLGYNIKGRNYSPAWGGQFQSGGFLQPTSPKLPKGYVIPYNTPSTELAMSIGGEDGEPAYLIPSFKGGKKLKDPIAEYKKTGEHLGGPFKTWQEAEKFGEMRHKYVEKGQNIPTPLKTWGDMAMGGSLPGAVGFTYARTINPAPSNGKYAKKTKASAQNGKDIQKERYNELYAPIENKVFDAIGTQDSYDKLPYSTKDFLNKTIAGFSVASNRNIPPMDPIIKEVQNKVQELSKEELTKLLNTNWSKISLAGAMKNTPSSVSYLDMLKYINHFNKLKKKGYTLQNGGEMEFYQNGLDWKPNNISKDGSVIKDDMGQWAHPGEITEIGSNEITMEGVPYDVIGISDEGDIKDMKPGKNYKFKGSKVTEYPMAQDGKVISDNTRVKKPITTSSIVDSKKQTLQKYAREMAQKEQPTLSTWNPLTKDEIRKQLYEEAESNKLKNKLLQAADVATDLMQIGNFVPNPVGQSIGKVGNVIGGWLDAYQATNAFDEGNYEDAAINLASVALPMALGANTFRRNSKYLQPGQPLNFLKGSKRVNYIEPFTKVKGMTNKNLMANRALLGTLGAETVYDSKQNGGWLNKYK